MCLDSKQSLGQQRSTLVCFVKLVLIQKQIRLQCSVSRDGLLRPFEQCSKLFDFVRKGKTTFQLIVGEKHCWRTNKGYNLHAAEKVNSMYKLSM